MVLHRERVSAARDAIREELTRRARIDERTEEILTKIEWPDQGRLPKLVTRFLDRARQRKESWLRPMKAAGCESCQAGTRPPRHERNAMSTQMEVSDDPHVRP